MFHVVMEWKYADVLNTAVITAVVLGTRLNLETVAEHYDQVRLNGG
jgi:hypothetical protein